MGCALAIVRRARGVTSSLDGYSFHEVLGAGTYGQVRACTDNNSGDEWAVKIVHLQQKRNLIETWLTQASGSTPMDSRSLATQEETLWKECCDHKHVLRLYQTFITDVFAFFIMDKCRCSLLDLLVDDPDDLDDEDRHSYYCQMIQAIEYVHSKGIIHRDIKPPNFLINASDADGTIKLCDFGLAIRTEAVRGTLHKIVGSPFFMAPEMAAGQDYDIGVDIFSLGVTIYVIAFCDLPYPDENRSKGLELANRYEYLEPSFVASCEDYPYPSSSTITFIKTLLELDPLQRKTATQCLQLDPVRKHANPRKGLLSRSLSKFSVTSEKSTASYKSTRSMHSTASGASMYSIKRQLKRGSTATASLGHERSVTSHDVQKDINAALKCYDPQAPMDAMPDLFDSDHDGGNSTYSSNSNPVEKKPSNDNSIHTKDSEGRKDALDKTPQVVVYDSKSSLRSSLRSGTTSGSGGQREDHAVIKSVTIDFGRSEGTDREDTDKSDTSWQIEDAPLLAPIQSLHKGRGVSSASLHRYASHPHNT